MNLYKNTGDAHHYSKDCGNLAMCCTHNMGSWERFNLMQFSEEATVWQRPLREIEEKPTVAVSSLQFNFKGTDGNRSLNSGIQSVNHEAV